MMGAEGAHCLRSRTDLAINGASVFEIQNRLRVEVEKSGDGAISFSQVVRLEQPSRNVLLRL